MYGEYDVVYVSETSEEGNLHLFEVDGDGEEHRTFFFVTIG